MRQRLSQGSALIFAMVLGIIIVGFAGSAITLAHYSAKYNQQQGYNLQARYTAEAGLARAFNYMESNFTSPDLSYSVVDALVDNPLQLWPTPQELTVTVDGKTVKIGEYTVEIKPLTSSDMTVPTGETITGETGTSCRYINAIATGYVPSMANAKARMTIIATYKMQTEASHLFDYSYFVNNWGKLVGNTTTSYGNVRSNGSFTLTGLPIVRANQRFDRKEGNDLIGPIDDNGDGKTNPQDGGVYAWDRIIGLPSKQEGGADVYQGLRGLGNTPSLPQLTMPNLTNLKLYESMSAEQGSYIKYYDPQTKSTKTMDGIWGDDTGETQNLYLEGTADHPIEIKGTNVVRGNVIIRGWVSGQGVIYSGRNIYLPQRILYANSTPNKVPSTNSEASREQWLDRSEDCDLLGLFARENVVIGDFTSSIWQEKVNASRLDPKNESKEDSGLDNIPNTGDQGENDGIFTIKTDSDGKSIAGSGEDVDGDGVYDGTTPMTAFNLTNATTNPNTFTSASTDWKGNIPTGVTKYSDITYWDNSTDSPGVYGDITVTTTTTTGSGKNKVTTVTTTTTPNPNISQNFPQIDAFIYTNHFVAAYINNVDGYNYKTPNKRDDHFKGTAMLEIFGSVISRNESLLFEGSGTLLAHDDRLTAETGDKYGFTMPRIWKPLTLISTSMQ